MTDKEQIIIDGVDVSDCMHFCLEVQIPEIPLAGYSNICCEENIAKECKDNPNCYFKQLARKMQECEELKKKLNTSEEWRIKAENLNEKQDLENTRYRKALEEIEEYCNSVSVEENLYNSRHFYNEGVTVEVVNEILNIINKAKGREDER